MAVILLLKIFNDKKLRCVLMSQSPHFSKNWLISLYVWDVKLLYVILIWFYRWSYRIGQNTEKSLCLSTNSLSLSTPPTFYLNEVLHTFHFMHWYGLSLYWVNYPIGIVKGKKMKHIYVLSSGSLHFVGRRKQKARIYSSMTHMPKTLQGRCCARGTFWRDFLEEGLEEETEECRRFRSGPLMLRAPHSKCTYVQDVSSHATFLHSAILCNQVHAHSVSPWKRMRLGDSQNKWNPLGQEAK